MTIEQKDKIHRETIEILIRLGIDETSIKQELINYAYKESTNHSVPVDMKLVDELFDKIKKGLENDK